MTIPDNQEDYFEVEIGTPTLTVRVGIVEHLIPWASFLGGSFHPKGNGPSERILLRFQEVEVILEGDRLQALWRKCRLQDLHWVQEIPDPSGDEWGGDGLVTSIRLITPDKEESAPPSGIH